MILFKIMPVPENVIFHTNVAFLLILPLSQAQFQMSSFSLEVCVSSLCMLLLYFIHLLAKHIFRGAPGMFSL